MLTSPTWQMERSESAHAIRGTGQTLQWVAADTAEATHGWWIERRPDGATWKPGTQPADVTMTGPARSLLLALARRLPLIDREATGISVEGDIHRAQHWLDNTAHISDCTIPRNGLVTDGAHVVRSWLKWSKTRGCHEMCP